MVGDFGGGGDLDSVIYVVGEVCQGRDGGQVVADRGEEAVDGGVEEGGFGGGFGPRFV